MADRAPPPSEIVDATDTIAPIRQASPLDTASQPAVGASPDMLAGAGNAALTRLLNEGESAGEPGRPGSPGQSLLALQGAGGNRALAAQFAGSGGSGGGPGGVSGSSNVDRIPIAVHFDRPLTGPEFMQLANQQLKVDPAKVSWRNIKDNYDPANSPVTVQVDTRLIVQARTATTATQLGLDVDDSGGLSGAAERAAELAAMPAGLTKEGLHAEMDRRYWRATGLPAGEKITSREAEPGRSAMWDQIRDEVLAERAFVSNLPAKAQRVFRTATGGLVIGPENYEQIVRIAGKVERMDPADLENYLRGGGTAADLSSLEAAVDTFLAAKAASADKIKELVAKTDEGKWDTDSAAEKLDAQTMFYLKLGDRIRVIKEIAGGTRVGDDDEQTIIRLLTSTPSGDLPGLIAALKADGSGLLKTLESVIDGAENKAYYAALRNIVFAAMQPEEAKKQMDNAKILPWADPGIIKAVYNVRFYYDTVEYTDDGKVRVVYWTNIAMFGIKNVEQVFEPDEMIGLHFFLDEDFADASKGETIFMPAANLIAFKNEQFSRELGHVVDIGLLFAGGVGLLGKGTRLVKAIAALDTALAVAAIAINSYRSDIAKTEQGKSFLRTWDTVNTLIAVYGIARLVVRLPEIFRNLRKAYQEFRAAADDMPPEHLSKIDGETGKLLDRAEEAIAESAVEELRGKFPGDRLEPFEKQLEKAAGITDAGKRQTAIADVESQVVAQQENVALIEELKKANPTKSNREIADLAADRIKVPNVPMGMDAEEFSKAQEFIKNFMHEKGYPDVQGFATGSRVTGATFNPKKPAFGAPTADFAGRDFDITLVTSKKMPNSQIKALTESYEKAFGHPLGVRNVSDPETLKHIPVFGKIELNLQ